jgi:hypothetical protein
LSPAASPLPPAVCDTVSWDAAWAYEDGGGILPLQTQCKAQLLTLMQQPFGPPSAYEVMNAVCKGSCAGLKARYERVRRAEFSSGCKCADLEPRCPKSPLEILCIVSGGICYDEDFYWEAVCVPEACGRWMANERDYRGARNRCKLSLDSGARGLAGGVAGAAALLALAGVAAAAAAGGAGVGG